MKKCIFISISVIIFLLSLISFIIYPRIELNEKEETIEVKTDYKGENVKSYNLLHKINSTKVKSNVNNEKVGTYKETYEAKYFIFKSKKTKTVKVVDNEKPTIKLEYEDTSICKDKYQEYKYSAIDNYDGDLTDKVEVSLDQENKKIIYKVKDTSGNEEVVEKEIEFKESTPKIKLIGSNNIYLKLNTNYKEDGATASDECDGDLTDKIKIEGTVNTKKEGTYKITYTVENSFGKKSTVTRTINIYKSNNKKVSYNGKGKVVYLTFDDGPGPYTKQFLDILDKYDVKVTFFVTHQFPKYTYLIKEEAKRGHAIAVHSYTHKWNIYKSVDAYLSDFNKMNKVIKEQTGKETKLFRFPGGSSNTVSRKQSKGIMTKLSDVMQSKGYVYFDWNVSSGDAAGGSVSSTKIYNNVVNGVHKRNYSIVLCHDIKTSTLKALPSILETLTNEGYEFRVLTESSPTVHQKIAN